MINHNEYSSTELHNFINVIHGNVYSAIRSGIRYVEEDLCGSWKEIADIVTQFKAGDCSLSPKQAELVSKIWASKEFQKKAMRWTLLSQQALADSSSSVKMALSASSEAISSATNANMNNAPSAVDDSHSSQDATVGEDKESSEIIDTKWVMEDGALYFMNHLARISEEGYVPTKQDILHARQKTTGVIETQFVSNNALFRIVDVGGQRSERKKWSVLFSDITGVIFCADVSCYDTPLREDPDTNRMIDSLQTFERICTNKDLRSRDIILFLNKIDLLARKIKRSPFPTDLFPGAPTEGTTEDALSYIQSLYKAKSDAGESKFIYVHRTVAVDSASIKEAFTETVKEIVRKDNVLASF